MNDQEIKSSRELGDLIGIVRREQLRTQILVVLDECYPKELPVLRIWGVLKKKNRDSSIAELRSEIAYLVEKSLVHAGTKDHVRVTARARDILDGHTEEIGLADVSMFR